MTSWDAPPASPAPAAWTPDLDALGDRRDGLHVTGWLRSVLPPRRGGIDTAVRPLAGLDDAWAGLRFSIWAQDHAIREASSVRSRVWGLLTSPEASDRRLGERLLAVEPRIGTAAEDVALVRAVREKFQYVHQGVDEWLADFLVAAHGLPEACRRVLDGFHVDLPYLGTGVFGRLRELLVIADDTTYTRTLQTLLGVRDERAAVLDGNTRADLFWAVSHLIPVGPRSGPDEQQAHAEALRHVGEFGNSPVHACGLASGDLDTLSRFLKANPRVRHEFFGTSGGRLHLAGVLDVAGAAAGPVLARMRPSYPFEDHPHYNGVWCSLLAHVDDDTAREVLEAERSAGHPWATGFTAADEQAPPVPQGVPSGFESFDRQTVPLLDVSVPPEIRFRDAERETAERAGVYEDAERWDGVPISRCDEAQVTAWLEHREHWRIPATLPALALAPRWTHERLMALGFDIQQYWIRSLIPLLLLRHGVSHVAPLAAAFEVQVDAALEAAQPVGHVSLTAPVARAFAGKKHRRLARSWLLRHPAHAAAGAIAMGTGDPAAARVLRYLDTQGHRSLLLDRDPGLAAFLDEDPLDAPGADLPKIPAYLTASDFLVRLASCDADYVHPAVLAARTNGDPVALAALADTLFEKWLAAGTPPADSWCMQAVGLIGDDAGARKLASYARQWAGTNAAARAQAALDALRHRGTDAALIELSLLAERSRFPVFKSRAREHIEAIAERQGLTADELADRLVPSLGLSGSDTLDAGGVTWRIGFDHQLLPVLHGPGKPPRSVPGLAALRKEARASASLHITRLERAMCTERRIPAAVFQDRFARHPWMTHLAQRLVWGVLVDDTLVSTVRVAEDGSLATVDDDAFTLPPAASLVVAHPVRQSLDEWGPVFADYELLPPFPQVDRPTYTDFSAFDRYIGLSTTYGALRGLERHGWIRWYDASVQMAKPLPGGGHAILRTDPGWHASDTVDSAPPQTVVGLSYDSAPPVAFSEMIHDLRTLS
ncbi:DUF4132 domain-containing protein [Actinoplanes rectilineatus]|uniref:DUF4132 domain-containing protein n=1 Tax=Actinoplanes rectilineatus TaxID=113571 RepID=UPI000695BD33|nr:DUF4132 domain-containing protein [Actinoplanes rectilineatus]